jgi:hypothetical protein
LRENAKCNGRGASSSLKCGPIDAAINFTTKGAKRREEIDSGRKSARMQKEHALIRQHRLFTHYAPTMHPLCTRYALTYEKRRKGGEEKRERRRKREEGI